VLKNFKISLTLDSVIWHIFTCVSVNGAPCNARTKALLTLFNFILLDFIVKCCFLFLLFACLRNKKIGSLCIVCRKGYTSELLLELVFDASVVWGAKPTKPAVASGPCVGLPAVFCNKSIVVS